MIIREVLHDYMRIHYKVRWRNSTYPDMCFYNTESLLIYVKCYDEHIRIALESSGECGCPTEYGFINSVTHIDYADPDFFEKMHKEMNDLGAISC